MSETQFFLIHFKQSEYISNAFTFRLYGDIIDWISGKEGLDIIYSNIH